MTSKYLLATVLGAAVVAAHAADAPAGAPEAKRICLSVLQKHADQGDGKAARALAIYYGTDARDDALAFSFLKQAIVLGVDVSDVPKSKSANIPKICEKDPAFKAAMTSALPAEKPVESAKAANAPKTVEATKAAGGTKPVAKAEKPAAEARPAKPVKPAAVVKPAEPAADEVAALRKIEPGKPASSASAAPARDVKVGSSAIEYERLAADAEWNGKVSDALAYWQKARDGGSRAAAKRLYQIYSFGAGDVHADYVKAIEAAQAAQQLGIEVPQLPRK